MTMKLYFSPGACSFVPHCLLEAAGAEFEPVMVKLHKGEQSGAEYLALNPRGQVPVLVDGDAVITQIVAICTYINDLFPGQQFFSTTPLVKAKALETLSWMNNTVHPTFTHVFMPRYFSDEEVIQAGMKTFNAKKYGGLLKELNALVEAIPTGREWLSGTHFGPLDAYALTLCRWGAMAGHDPVSFKALWQHVQKVAQHPPVARVIERERLVLNVYKP
jgi:glutathione S-transferase